MALRSCCQYSGNQSRRIKLSGEVIADIFLGKIKKWNDPAIAALNDGIALPDKNILVVRRSDGSGTTFGWTNYLSKVSAEWKEKVGEGNPLNGLSDKAEKVMKALPAYVKQLKYSIGYVEYAYAKQNQLTWVTLQNAAGKFVHLLVTALWRRQPMPTGRSCRNGRSFDK